MCNAQTAEIGEPFQEFRLHVSMKNIPLFTDIIEG